MQLPRNDDDRAATAHALAERGNRRTLRTGEVLFHQGTPSTSIAVITEGLVKVAFDDEAGRTGLVTVLGPGEVIGEIGVILGEDRTMRIEAVTPAGVSVVRSADFADLIAEQPQIAVDLIAQTVGRQRDLNAARHDRETLPVAARLAGGLVRLHDVFVPTGVCTLSQEELGAWIGAARPQISEAVGILREMGLITTGRRRIEVPDVDALADYVDSHRD